MLTRADYLEHYAARSDARVARAIIDGVATACPFPVVVYYEPDYVRFRVAAGPVTLAVIEREDLAGRSEGMGILYIVNRALLGYAALEPLPHDHPLGQD